MPKNRPRPRRRSSWQRWRVITDDEYHILRVQALMTQLRRRNAWLRRPS